MSGLRSCIIPPCNYGEPKWELSATHRALSIAEIFLDILQFVRPEFSESTSLDGQRKIGSCTLARVARTCKTFRFPASDLLWQEHYDLDVFLTIFDECVSNISILFLAENLPADDIEIS